VEKEEKEEGGRREEASKSKAQHPLPCDCSQLMIAAECTFRSDSTAADRV
jgi:hypothetical protein